MGLSDSGITVELDLLGSTLNLGIATNRRDRAVRRGEVKGLSISFDDGSPEGRQHRLLQLAAESAFHAAGLFHNTLLDLPLQDIRARQWGKAKAWVDLIYYRDFRTLNTPGGGIAFVYTQPVSSWIQVYRGTMDEAGREPAFSPHGLPAGPMYGSESDDSLPERLKDPRILPWGYMWERGGTKINVPTSLSFHPYSEPGVANAVGAVNSDNVVLGGINFAPFTLKFESTTVVIRQGGFGPGDDTVLYDTVYEWLAIGGPAEQPGHYRQKPVWIQVLKKWETIEDIEFPAVPFTGLFPLGT